MFGVLKRPRRAPLGMLVAATVAGVFVIAAGAGSASASWTYERVTPVNKDGGAVMATDTFRAAPDGSALLYSSTGSFAGVPSQSVPQYVRYLARRGSTGWTNEAVDPPWDLGASGGGAAHTTMLTLGSSENLGWLVQTSNFALTPGATPDGSNLYLRNTESGELHLVATGANRGVFTNIFAQHQGAASHIRFVGNDGTVVFNTSAQLLPAEAPGATAYRWTPQGGFEGMGRKPALLGPDYFSGGALGHSGGENGARSPVPPTRLEGATLYYVMPGTGAGAGVYKVGATADEPMEPVSWDRTAAATGTRPAGIVGTSADGRYVVFQLIVNVRLTDDTPALGSTARYLYRYDRDSDDLDYVGAASSNALSGARSGVRQVSADGGTVVFDSEIVQAPGAVNARGNTYVWREGEPLRLIKSSDAGSNAETATGWVRGLSRNGRYFMFTDSSFGVAQRFGYDNRSVACSSTASPAPCRMVYRHDVETDQLDCVSCRPDGQAPNGHTGTPLVEQPGFLRMDARQVQYVADDGTVFFDSSDPLVPTDANGLEDTYAWRDGEFRLVSRGTPGARGRFIDATPDGATVFFATSDAIVPSDVDAAVDIYAARRDGGFTEPEDGSPGSCLGSDCRSALPAPPVSPFMGSTVFGGDGNASSRPGGGSAARLRVARLRSAGPSAQLRVRVSGPGRVSVTGPAVRQAARQVSGAGAHTVRVVLNPRARRQLAQRNSLRTRVRVVYRSREGRSASQVVPLTFRQPGPSALRGGR